jgi:hypothetical protein
MDVILEAMQKGLERREVKTVQRGMAPVVRPDFQDVQPEVTIAADIVVQEEEPEAVGPRGPRRRKRPGEEAPRP